MKTLLRFILSLLLIVTCVACGGSETKTSVKGKKAKTTSQTGKSKPQPSDDGVKLNVASWEETLAMVKKHQGKVVVVDVWSTSCPPCMKEFPHLIELHHKYKGDVVCLSLSLDNDGGSPEGAKDKDLQARVLSFLQLKKSVITNLICSDTDEQFYEKQKPDLGTVPAVFVFSKDGTLKERFDDTDTKRLGGPFSYTKHIFPMIEELRASP